MFCRSGIDEKGSPLLKVGFVDKDHRDRSEAAGNERGRINCVCDIIRQNDGNADVIDHIDNDGACVHEGQQVGAVLMIAGQTEPGENGQRSQCDQFGLVRNKRS